MKSWSSLNPSTLKRNQAKPHIKKKQLETESQLSGTVEAQAQMEGKQSQGKGKTCTSQTQQKREL